MINLNFCVKMGEMAGTWSWYYQTYSEVHSLLLAPPGAISKAMYCTIVA